MTAKEKLQATVEELSEAEAADTLDYIASRRQGASDALGDLLAKAPLDDEPTTADEEAGLVEARDQAARGDVVSAEEVRRVAADQSDREEMRIVREQMIELAPPTSG